MYEQLVNQRKYWFQLVVEAYDTAETDLLSQASVFLNILRNLNGPVVIPNQYSARVNDYDSQGTFVLKINATDSDVTVCRFIYCSSQKILKAVIFASNKATTFLIEPINIYIYREKTGIYSYVCKWTRVQIVNWCMDHYS